MSETNNSNDNNIVLHDLLDDFLKDNEIFMNEHNTQYFGTFKDAQKPRATIVMCSDSRVQTNNFDFTADNDLFMIRNIGNLFESNKGSVEYGVLHLKTPILLFIGHSECGAVKAVYEGHYNELELDIQNELASLNNQIGDITRTTLNETIIENIRNQINKAHEHFSNYKTKSSEDKLKLLICGAFYDFKNVMKKGYGKLIILEDLTRKINLL
jgi:carbonic anhydrase